MKSLLAVVFALFSSAALAAPTITSVAPANGPAGGGMNVTITGTGFSMCVICSPATPPQVFFGATEAASVTLVSSTTIEAISPPHPAATVSVTVVQFDGSVSLPSSFTFTGDVFAALEPVLIPVFSPPVRGQFGSDFRTTVVVGNKGGSGRVLLYGLDTSCFLITPVLGPLDARAIEPNGGTVDLPPDCASWPAKLFYVPTAQAQFLTFNARVRDVSRSDLSHGTEIPIVRASEFARDRIVLLNVPIDARFRNTLRIYSLTPGAVTVFIDDIAHVVNLQAGHDAFEPAYAMFTSFPLQGAPRRVTIVPATPGAAIWAFISVTNNVTQEITTITPD